MIRYYCKVDHSDWLDVETMSNGIELEMYHVGADGKPETDLSVALDRDQAAALCGQLASFLKRNGGLA